MRNEKTARRIHLLRAVFSFAAVTAHASGAVPTIAKIDPPNWWSGMPKPMLLVNGEYLSGAKFTLSDRHLRVTRTTISSNGHWAEVWLDASPSKPETVTLNVRTNEGETNAPYRFEQRRSPTDGLAGFSSRDAMYLIMPDRFSDGDPTNDGPDPVAERAKPRGWHGGDLRGIDRHLDYIQDLGFTTIWMTPVYANLNEPESYHGYGATDLYAVDPHYGSLADLQKLAADLHRRHMKLVLDTVPNHVGEKIAWVDDEPDPAWLHGTKADHHRSVGNFRPLVDPHAPWRDQRDVLEGWFANRLPDLNQENPATAQYLIQNSLWWIEETGADGLRIDTFPYVGRAFWHDYHAQIHGVYPNVTTVGEIFNCDATITSFFAGGVTHGEIDTGLDTPFDFPSYCALRDVFLKDEPLSHLPDVWRLDALYPHPERLVPFLGNHDNSRFLSNRGATPEKMRLAFAILLTMRGMPQVYSGDEIAMLGGEDPDNRRDFPPSAFGARTPEQAAMHDWVRQLLAVRAKYPALQTGEMQVLASGKDFLAYARGKVLVVVNRSEHPAAVKIALGNTLLGGATGAETLAGEGVAHWSADQVAIDLPNDGVWIASVR